MVIGVSRKNKRQIITNDETDERYRGGEISPNEGEWKRKGMKPRKKRGLMMNYMSTQHKIQIDNP
jgi:hypothetical protein